MKTWIVRSLLACVSTTTLSVVAVFFFLVTKPTFYRHTLLVRAGSVSVPGLTTSTLGVGAKSFAANLLSNENEGLVTEAVAVLDFEHETSKVLKKLITNFGGETPPDSFVRSIEQVKGTDYINIEVWGRDVAKAEARSKKVFEELQAHFNPRIQSAKDALTLAESKFNEMLKEIESADAGLDLATKEIGFNEVIARQKAATREQYYLVQKELGGIVAAIKLENVRPFTVISERTEEKPAFPAPVFVSILVGLIMFVMTAFTAFIWYPGAFGPVAGAVATSSDVSKPAPWSAPVAESSYRPVETSPGPSSRVIQLPPKKRAGV